MKTTNKGFTLVEFLFYTTAFCIFFGVGCTNYFKAKDKAKEAEVKANCHTIQIALERYALDHSGIYPKQIFGGDERGWSSEVKEGQPYGCLAVYKASQSGLQIPKDPLIYFGYMHSYPRNPFIEEGKGRNSIIFWTSGFTELGFGDPRFGYTGEIMGNCLNDPRYLWEMVPFQPPPVLGPEQYHIYDWAGTEEKGIRMVNPDNAKNPFYSMGGFVELPSEIHGSDMAIGPTIKGHWPGEFFYRSGGDFFIVSIEKIKTGEISYTYIWDMPYMRIHRYILGGYGGPRTEGTDVIRLTWEDGRIANNTSGYIPTDKYVTHEDFCDTNGKPFWEVHLSTPECMGGGGRGVCPTFPYWSGSGNKREWLYGAPDGFRDGVIICITSPTDTHTYMYPGG